MKINRLETHDRWEQFGKQKDLISQECQSLIDKRPFGDRPFYIFAHKREIGLDEKLDIFARGYYKSIDLVPSARIIWQPRLTKPKPQTNSMLFKGYPGTDMIKVIWMIPDPNLWGQYKKGNLTQCSIVVESIHLYKTDKAALEKKEDDDISEEEAHRIYRDIAREAHRRRENESKQRRIDKEIPVSSEIL